MGSSCWADVPAAMPSKAVITAVREEYMIIVWNKSQQRTPADGFSDFKHGDDDSRLGRRHEELKQEGKRQ